MGTHRPPAAVGVQRLVDVEDDDSVHGAHPTSTSGGGAPPVRAGWCSTFTHGHASSGDHLSHLHACDEAERGHDPLPAVSIQIGSLRSKARPLVGGPSSGTRRRWIHSRGLPSTFACQHRSALQPDAGRWQAPGHDLVDLATRWLQHRRGRDFRPPQCAPLVDRHQPALTESNLARLAEGGLAVYGVQ